MNLFFSECFFLSTKLNVFFLNWPKFNVRTGQKKNTCFFSGNARPESNAHAHLKQRKNIVA